MKRIFLIVLILGCNIAFAQNLVSNPSFEAFEDCPYTCSMVYTPTDASATVSDWYIPSAGSSDYYNTCAPATYMPFPVSIPGNWAGYQQPRTGDAYAGFYALLNITLDESTWYREYIQAPLSTPLIAGHHYYVRYWIALSFDYLNMTAGYDQFGAYFSSGYLSETTYEALPYTPQVQSPSGYIYTDTANWEAIAGTFVAEGGEDWIVIGNFTPYDLIHDDKIFYFPDYADILPLSSYYYLDDVCVIDLDGSSAEAAVQQINKCSNDTVRLTGRHSAAGYLWSDGSTDSSLLVYTPGEYWVKSVDTADCAFYMDSFTVTNLLTPIEIDLGNDTVICDNANMILDAFDTIFTEYRWSTGAATASISVNAPGTYYVTATSECNTGTDTIRLTSPDPPVAGLPGDTILCEGSSIVLSNSEEGFRYLWNTGDTTCCIPVTDSGTYIINVFNECDEAASDDAKVQLSACNNCLMIPNAFSPNNDGLNDRFSVYVNCPMKSYRFSIFNRWGQVVFTSVKPGDEGWDGMVNGQPCDAGTYFYYLEATPLLPEAGSGMKQKGDITLIR